MANKINQRRKIRSIGAGRRSASNAQTSHLYNDVMGLAGSLLRSRQQAGAEQISSLASAAYGFGESLHDVPSIQTYVSDAASQLETLSDYVAATPLENIISDAGDFAKRYPMATAAFALAVGFAITRLMSESYGANEKRKSSRTIKNTKAKSRRATASANLRAKPNGRGTLHAESNVN
jgi:hypothetical protein